MTAEGFPRELLAQPKAARLAYFQSKVVAHPRLKEAHAALWQAIRRPAGASLILVVGPTGVGKTTLRLGIERQLLEEARAAMEHDPGYIPVVGLEAVAPESGNFKWKDYYTRALIALDEPLRAHKLDYGVRNVQRDGAGRLVIGQSVVASELRWALEQCLRHRRPAAFLVDEAQHFKKMASGRRLLDQMDTLKSLAGLTGTVHVLIGTYELLSLANLSAQLSRRSLEIHFPRYRLDGAQEIARFQSVLLTFQSHLPLRQAPDLAAQAEYFYERCLGCVGVLKNWLDRALAAALDGDRDTLTPKDFERQAMPTGQRLRLAREIQAGEAALLERGEGQTELRRLLGLNGEPNGWPEVQPDPPEAASQRAPAVRGAKGRVGQRKPGRDPVGMAEHAG